MSYGGSTREADIPSIDLANFVLARARDLGDKPALIDGPSGRTVSYAELDRHPARSPHPDAFSGA
jgi:hypothetical protein